MSASAEDRLAIMDLVTRYNRAFDSLDAEKWAATFTDDGEFVGAMGNPRGRDALIAHVRNFASNPDMAAFRNGQHWVGNCEISVEGDSATLVASYMYVVNSDAGPQIALMGSYEDALRRVSGEWRFVRRVAS